MTRLPTPGSDSGQWGDILNNYLSQSHTADGKLKTDSVTAAQLAPGAVKTAAIADGTITNAKLDAPTKASLASADAAIQDTDPRLTDARTPTTHAASHASAGSDPLTIDQSQVTNLTTDLAGKAPAVHTHTASAISDSTTVGRSLITAADAAAQRTSLGLGGSATLAVGTTAGTVAAGDDSRLSNSRTPTAHASAHASAGSDPVTIAQSQVTNLTTDLAAKVVAAALDAATNILSNGNFVGTTGWTGIYGSLSATANVLSVTGAGSVTYFGARQTTTVTYTAGHKVYQRARFRVTDANCVTVRFSYTGSVSGGATTTVQSAPAINTWYEKSIVHTLNAGSGSVLETFYAYYASAGATSGKVMDLQYVISIDLTAAFGAGSEPTAAQMDTLLAHFTNKWFDGTVYDGTLFNERIGEVGREVVHAATTAAARTALGVEIAVGKNLLDVSTVTAGYYVADSYGGLQASTNYSASAFIPISASTVYTLSHKQYLCE